MSKSLMSNSTSGAFAAKSIASARTLSNNPVKVYTSVLTGAQIAADSKITDTGINIPTGSAILYTSIVSATSTPLADSYFVNMAQNLTGGTTTTITTAGVPPLYSLSSFNIMDASEPYITLVRTGGGTADDNNAVKITIVAVTV